MSQPTKLDITTKASVLLEALPYIQRFRSSIFVVKYGGAFLDDADTQMCARVATDIAFLHATGIKVVVVHGGGKAITRELIKSKVDTRFEYGLRVTDADSIKVVDYTLNKIVNLDICELLQAKNACPLAIPGNNILLCEKKKFEVDGKSLDLGYVGEIHTVKSKIIKKALEDGYIPIISSIACDEGGQIYNINADEAAGRVASALRARRLVYLCDVPGLMHNLEEPESLISSLKTEEVAKLIADGIINKGMIPKTESAIKALSNGVQRVHLINGQQDHSLLLEIFTDKGVGTEIVNA